ncbi:MAG: iron ABC transporter permease [Thermoplasmata archaeon]|nr:iron ABC transporter permease [Thermoplasmata archaeon]
MRVARWASSRTTVFSTAARRPCSERADMEGTEPPAVDTMVAEENGIEETYMAYRFRKILLIIGLSVLLFVFTFYALSFNGMDIGFADCISYVFNHIFGTTYDKESPEWMEDYILWKMYVPRVVMAIVAGASLAICGVAMQSLMNNPLADPYTVGISDGACFGAVASIVMGASAATVASSAGLVVSAFICGLIPAVIIIMLSTVVRLTPATSILIGVALSYIFSGMEAMLMVTTDADTLKNAYLWQIGSLDKVVWDNLVIPTVVVIVCSVYLIITSNKLNLLSLGDDSATSLGLDVKTFRTLTMIIVSVTVAAVVSFVGIIGFVGLVAPHMIRLIIGGDNKYLIPVSMLAGALFLQVADIISRTAIAPEELRVGLIASIIGAPIFLYIILKRKRNYGEAL